MWPWSITRSLFYTRDLLTKILLFLPCTFLFYIFVTFSHTMFLLLILNSYHEPSGKKRSTPLIWLNSNWGEYHSPVLTVLQKMVQAWNFNFLFCCSSKAFYISKKKMFCCSQTKYLERAKLRGWNMLYMYK